MKFTSLSLAALSLLAGSAVSTCNSDLLVDDFNRVITDNRNLLQGEYGDGYAPYTFTSGPSGSITAGTPPSGDNYWFFKNDAAACFDLRPYSAFEFEMTIPVGTTFLFTLTQKMPDCTTRGVDSQYHDITTFVTPNGQKQTFTVPLSAFATNIQGGAYDFQRLKDLTIVNFQPAGTVVKVHNIKMIGACTSTSSVASSTSSTTGTVTSSTSVATTTSSSATPTASGLADWNKCSLSSQCSSNCCSGEYSNGILKCTPAGSSSQCVTPSPSPLADWNKCTLSSECSSNCCSGQYSNGILKCTPAGSTTNCAGKKLGDWNPCSSSGACASGCCSQEYSTTLKCTPAGSSSKCIA